MKAARSHIKPFTLRCWLLTRLPEVRDWSRWQLIRRSVLALASSLVFLVCCGGAATAFPVDERVAISRDVSAPAPCIGDCNTDGAVAVDEILLLSTIALGEADTGTCPTGDVNHDGHITIDEIIAAVNSALNGCPAQPATPTPSPVAIATLTPSFSPTSTASSAPTATPTPASLGPLITYFGLAGQFRDPQPTAGTDPQGNPIFTKPPNSNGRGFYIVVEAGVGPSGLPPGTMTSNSDPAGRPDLQIQADRDLGDGSTLVCDAAPVGPNPTPTITPGGVPGINASVPNHCTKDPEQCITDALNDFGCRFVVILTSENAITEPTPGVPRFVNPTPSRRQYISPEPIGPELALATGDTLLTVRVRDSAGNLSDPNSIVLRVP